MLKRMATRLRRFDCYAEVCVAFACGFVMLGAVAYAQTFPSQEMFNGSVSATLIDYGRRIDKLETALNWATTALIANLGAHLFQISGQMKRRRDQQPTVTER